MVEEYSAGFHGKVNQIHDKSGFCSQADLRKESTNTDSREAKLEFYGMQIAWLLFPDHFIEVTGAMTTETEPIDDIYRQWQHQLYSRIANTSPDHAVYAKHFTTSSVGTKINCCRCQTCHNHRKTHNRVLRNEVKDIARQMAQKGIFVTEDDSSDYCFDQNTGKVIFFEIEGLNIQAIKAHIAQKEDKSDNDYRVLKLLERYQEIAKLKPNQPPIAKRTRKLQTLP